MLLEPTLEMLERLTRAMEAKFDCLFLNSILKDAVCLAIAECGRASYIAQLLLERYPAKTAVQM